jgi:hypothetical protein
LEEDVIPMMRRHHLRALRARRTQPTNLFIT